MVNLQCFVLVVGAMTAGIARHLGTNLDRILRFVTVRCSAHGGTNAVVSTGKQGSETVLAVLGHVSVLSLAAQLPAEVMSSV